MTDSKAEVLDPQGEDAHQCHFCGTYVLNGYECGENKDVRHWLSDCRPDLVEHEEGPLCTWPDRNDGTYQGSHCYAYQYWGGKEVGYKQIWGTEHKHFFSDGPM